MSAGAVGGGEGAPGHPSTHPTEGCDQGQQGGCNAVLVQGGAVLRQGREPLGPAPHTPASQQAPPLATVPEPPAPAARGWPEVQGRMPWRPPTHEGPLWVARGARARHPARGGTCRQQFIMRTTKSNCWWSRTARFCCACRCSSCARQRRAARPFKALSTAGSSWGQEHRADGMHRHGDPQPCPQRAQAELAGPPGARAQALSTETQTPTRPGARGSGLEGSRPPRAEAHRGGQRGRRHMLTRLCADALGTGAPRP